MKIDDKWVEKVAKTKPLYVITPFLLLGVLVIVDSLRGTIRTPGYASIIVGGLLFTLTFLFYIGWPSSIAYLLQSRGILPGPTERTLGVLAGLPPILFVVAVLIQVIFLDGPMSDQGPIWSAIGGLLGLAIWACILALWWIAARALVLAKPLEERTFGETFGVFLMFFYWPIGAFFVHNRLMKICRQPVHVE